MKWLRTVWRDLVDYVNQDPPIIIELREVCDKAEKYERLEKHYPDEIARMNAAIDEKEHK